MTHRSDPMHDDGIYEALTMYAFDLCSPEDAQRLERHLAECAECDAELRAIRETMAELPAALPDAAPHPRVRRKVLAAAGLTRKAPPEQPVPGIFVMRHEEQRWRTTAYPGVTYKVLHVDAETNNITTILRLEPGSSYPAHRHTGVEQCLVLEGTVRIGTIILHAGDFEFAQAGTEHANVETDDGCQLLIIANKHDEILA